MYGFKEMHIKHCRALSSQVYIKIVPCYHVDIYQHSSNGHHTIISFFIVERICFPFRSGERSEVTILINIKCSTIFFQKKELYCSGERIFLFQALFPCYESFLPMGKGPVKVRKQIECELKLLSRCLT